MTLSTPWLIYQGTEACEDEVLPQSTWQIRGRMKPRTWDPSPHTTHSGWAEDQHAGRPQGGLGLRPHISALFSLKTLNKQTGRQVSTFPWAVPSQPSIFIPTNALMEDLTWLSHPNTAVSGALGSSGQLSRWTKQFLQAVSGHRIAGSGPRFPALETPRFYWSAQDVCPKPATGRWRCWPDLRPERKPVPTLRRALPLLCSRMRCGPLREGPAMSV